MLKGVADLTSEDYSRGLNTVNNFFSLTPDQSPNMINVRIDPDGSVSKRLGSSTMNSTIIAESGGSGFSPVATASLTARLIAWWNMNEAAGTRGDNFADHDLSDRNSVGNAAGIRGRAALFVAANSEHLDIANTGTLAMGDTSFTLASWVYLTATGNYGIITKRDNDRPDPNTVLLLHMSGGNGSTTIPDSARSNNTVTSVNSAQIETAQSRYLGSACRFFLSESSALNIPASTDFDFGANDFTVETHVRFVTFNSSTETFDHFIFHGSGDLAWHFDHDNNNNFLRFVHYANGTGHITSANFAFAENTWYHVAAVRSENAIRLYVDGSQAMVTDTEVSTIHTTTGAMIIGANNNNVINTRHLNGFLDDLRISNVARYAADFTVSDRQHGQRELEYWLYVRSDSNAFFEVSSDGMQFNGSIQASSFGALSTATWYNIIGWHNSTANLLGIAINGHTNSASYTAGVQASSAPLTIGGESGGEVFPASARIDDCGIWSGKVLSDAEELDLFNSGDGNSFEGGFSNQSWASFDFGATDIRWIVAAVGTGIYASSNLGVTWVTIATDRTSSWQYFERSRNLLVATSEARDNNLYWYGSAGSVTSTNLLNNSAANCKYAINFQGFLMLFNSAARPRGVYYEDQNTQLTGDWAEDFDLPSSFDDEITGPFIIRKRLYVSTKRKLFRLTYVGGNPDFEFLEIKNWGYIPRTMKKVTLSDVGEVVVGLDWTGKIRLFDGSDDKIISDSVENDNGYCEFALDNLSYAGSGPIVSFAETDVNENVYKLAVAIGADSTRTTHFLNFDGITGGFSPDSGRDFNTMVMAESGNRQYLMAFDRSGYCAMINSGNLDKDTAVIDDVFDSNFLFDDSPSEVLKSHRLDLHFSVNSAGSVYLLDRSDFSDTFTLNERFEVTSGGSLQHHESIDIPQEQNVYQYRLTSSSGTRDPWILNRHDLFTQKMGIGKSGRIR